MKSKNTGIELKMNNMLQGMNLTGYTKNEERLPGSPDFVFWKQKIAIFTDGCLWHGCSCRLSGVRDPQFIQQITAQKAKDEIVHKTLKVNGWIVLRYWEHEINRNMSRIGNEIYRALKSRGY